MFFHDSDQALAEPGEWDANAVRTPPFVRRALGYAAAAWAALTRSEVGAATLARWAGDRAEDLYLPLTEAEADALARLAPNRPVPAETWARVGTLLGTGHRAPRQGRNFTSLADAFSLHSAERAILGLAVEYKRGGHVETLWDGLSAARGGPQFLHPHPALFALLLRMPRAEAERALAAGGRLRTGGLLLVEGGSLAVPRRVLSFLSGDGAAEVAGLVGPALRPSLTPGHFAHLGADRDRVLAVLSGALREGVPGVHVLLHGPPGTGKTELAKVLATEVGAPLHAVGERDEGGEELNAASRLSEFALAQRLMSGGRRALLLMDEAEDLFERGTGGRPSRVFLHRLLEAGPAPVIWTANALHAFGDAVLRRMSCCLEVRVPGPEARIALWTRAAEEEGIAVPAETLMPLARDMPVAPALARSALRAARLAGGDLGAVRWALTGVARAMGGGERRERRGAPEGYAAGLVSADVDLAALADRLAAPDAPRAVSFLLSGPPGSGKSAYARHLAARMGLEVMHRRASDILDPYVGGTEAKIAATFAEARASGAFLVLDEADSLLFDRGRATRSWEVSGVNEVLTWMEDHPAPFACTTNLPEWMDPATARRFTVVARFGFLSPAQARAAWRASLGGEPPSGLEALATLTPADFDLVRRRAVLLGAAGDAAALLRMLSAEAAAKPGAGRPVGFLRGAA